MAVQKADFGFKEVAVEHKQTMVQEVFSNVANKYDLMNDLMSFGMHHLWKREMLCELRPSCDEKLLDVAGGTGDIAHLYLANGGHSAIVADLNENMLAAGRQKYPADNIEWVHANAESLPFADNSFDFYSISFGIRNVTHIDKVLAEAYRVLKLGGKFVCLEFSNVSNDNIKKVYDWYSFKVIPKIGSKIAKDGNAYQYLVESIRKFPNASKFEHMIKTAGFSNVEYRKLTFGVVAIHIGYKAC